MGRAIEWDEVVTEGANLEECRALLRDALSEVVLACRDLGREPPVGNVLLEQLPVEMDRITANELCKQAGLVPKY